MYYSEPIAPHVSESNYDRAKRHYTETKEMHKGASTEDKEHKMKALDMYIRELSGDISELLNDMTPDERNLLRTKMSNLASVNSGGIVFRVDLATFSIGKLFFNFLYNLIDFVTANATFFVERLQP